MYTSSLANWDGSLTPRVKRLPDAVITGNTQAIPNGTTKASYVPTEYSTRKREGSDTSSLGALTDEEIKTFRYGSRSRPIDIDLLDSPPLGPNDPLFSPISESPKPRTRRMVFDHVLVPPLKDGRRKKDYKKLCATALKQPAGYVHNNLRDALARAFQANDHSGSPVSTRPTEPPPLPTRPPKKKARTTATQSEPVLLPKRRSRTLYLETIQDDSDINPLPLHPEPSTSTVAALLNTRSFSSSIHINLNEVIDMVSRITNKPPRPPSPKSIIPVSCLPEDPSEYTLFHDLPSQPKQRRSPTRSISPEIEISREYKPRTPSVNRTQSTAELSSTSTPLSSNVPRIDLHAQLTQQRKDKRQRQALKRAQIESRSEISGTPALSPVENHHPPPPSAADDVNIQQHPSPQRPSLKALGKRKAIDPPTPQYNSIDYTQNSPPQTGPYLHPAAGEILLSSLISPSAYLPDTMAHDSPFGRPYFSLNHSDSPTRTAGHIRNTPGPISYNFEGDSSSGSMLTASYNPWPMEVEDSQPYPFDTVDPLFLGHPASPPPSPPADQAPELNGFLIPPHVGSPPPLPYHDPGSDEDSSWHRDSSAPLTTIAKRKDKRTTRPPTRQVDNAWDELYQSKAPSPDVKKPTAPRKRVMMNWEHGSTESWCHQCRTKSTKLKMACRECTKLYCNRCIFNRYPDYVFDNRFNELHRCPLCTGTCTCDVCCRKRGEVYISSKPSPSKPKYADNDRQPRPSKPARARASGPALPKPPYAPTLPKPDHVVTGLVTFWAPVYGLDGKRMATGFVDGGLGEPTVIYAQADEQEAISRQRFFAGNVPKSWKLKQGAKIVPLDREAEALSKQPNGRRRIYVGKKPPPFVPVWRAEIESGTDADADGEDDDEEAEEERGHEGGDGGGARGEDIVGGNLDNLDDVFGSSPLSSLTDLDDDDDQCDGKGVAGSRNERSSHICDPNSMEDDDVMRIIAMALYAYNESRQALADADKAPRASTTPRPLAPATIPSGLPLPYGLLSKSTSSSAGVIASGTMLPPPTPPLISMYNSAGASEL